MTRRDPESVAGRMQEDPETGARYIYVADTEDVDVERTVTLGLCQVHVDYDTDGRIVGVELL